MDRTRTLLRYLRIATTALFVVLSVALIVLWVRSYHGLDFWQGHILGKRSLQVEFWKGEIIVFSLPGIWKSTFGTVSSSAVEVTGFKFQKHNGVPPAMSVRAGITYWHNVATVMATFRCWRVILTTFLLSLVPWIRWSKRFSLRTMLIGMTLIAAVLAIIAAGA